MKVAASETFQDLVESYGLAFVPVRGEISRMASREFAGAARTADNPRTFVTSIRNGPFANLLIVSGDTNSDHPPESEDET